MSGLKSLSTMVLLLCGGCTALVPSTLARLSALSPLQADPAGIALALTLPEGLALGPQGAMLRLEATNEATGETVAAAVALDIAGAETEVIRVAPGDLPRLRATQATARDWEAGPGARGSLGVTLDLCRDGDGPAEDARVSVAVRLSDDTPFRPLIDAAPVAQVADVTEIAALPPCAPSLH